MIGKLIRMLVGRSMAKKRGYSGLAGAAAGLIAPTLIKHGASLIGKTGSAALAVRRRRREPNFLPSVNSLGRSGLGNLIVQEGPSTGDVAENSAGAHASSSAGSGKAGTDKKLQDPRTYEKYEEAMGDLGDAGGAASIGGPAV
jgi:hypothetical protein